VTARERCGFVLARHVPLIPPEVEVHILGAHILPVHISGDNIDGGSTIDKLGIFWCELMHNAPGWPIHGHYTCRVCGRQRPVRWERQSASLPANVEQLTSPRHLSERDSLYLHEFSAATYWPANCVKKSDLAEQGL
jgi:hypothetical protein